MIPVGRWSDGTADPEVGMMMTHGQSPEQSHVNPEWNNAILHARISIGDTELMAAKYSTDLEFFGNCRP
jgi:uncharacterized glyoxalase superfamily protein PhnB